MSDTIIINSITTLKSFVVDLKKNIFRPKTGSFLFLFRSIHRYMELVEIHCKICSSHIGKNDQTDQYLMIITREIGDIRKMIFNHSEANDKFRETEEDIHDCFDQIEMNIEYLESMFTPEIAQ